MRRTIREIASGADLIATFRFLGDNSHDKHRCKRGGIVRRLKITIESEGEGKTVLQMLLAEFLESKGHIVRISDYFRKHPKDMQFAMRFLLPRPNNEVDPMEITIHVTNALPFVSPGAVDFTEAKAKESERLSFYRSTK